MQNPTEIFKQIQKQYSITYYYSTLLFPKPIRIQTHILYAFLRAPDEIVDNPTIQDPAQIANQLTDFETKFWELYNSSSTDLLKSSEFTIPIDLNLPEIKDLILKSFIHQAKTYNFDPDWIKAFFNSMRADLTKLTYHTTEELDQYIYGSAEVVGLMMTKIMSTQPELTPEQIKYAKLLGHAMQMTNFLRDFKEHLGRNRIYLPLEIAKQHNLDQKHLLSFKNFNEKIPTDPSGTNLLNFIKHFSTQISEEYNQVIKNAHHIPKSSRLPVLTSCFVYKSVLDKIKKNPELLFQKNFKKTKSSFPISIIKAILTRPQNTAWRLTWMMLEYQLLSNLNEIKRFTFQRWIDKRASIRTNRQKKSFQKAYLKKKNSRPNTTLSFLS